LDGSIRSAPTAFWLISSSRLTQFDRGELNDEEAEASVIAEYEAHIAALERKVGQLTMELDLVKKLRASRSPATAGTPPSSPVPSLFYQTGCKMIDLPRSSHYYFDYESVQPWGYGTRCNH